MERTNFSHNTIQISTLLIVSLFFATCFLSFPGFGLTVHNVPNSKQENGAESTDMKEIVTDENTQLKSNRSW